MDIRNCPECGEITINAGLAFWPDADEPVAVIECASTRCGWVGVEEDLLVEVVHRAAA